MCVCVRVVRMVYVPGQVQDSTVPNISAQGVKKLGKRVKRLESGNRNRVLDKVV